MSASRKIWTGTSFVAGANLLSRIGTFVANIAVVRLLTIDSLGQLGLIEGWLSLATMFSLFGISIASTRYIPQYIETEPELVGNLAGASLLICGVLSSVVSLLFYITLPLIQSKVLGESFLFSSEYIVLFVLLIVLSTLKQVILGIIYGLQAYFYLMPTNLLIGLLSFPASFILVRNFGLSGALAARLFLVAVETILLACAMRLALRRIGARISMRTFSSSFKQLIGFGVPVFLGELAANPIQPLMMSFLASQPGGIGQLGLITAATRLSSFAGFLQGSMASTILPVLSALWSYQDLAKFREGVQTALRIFWLTTIPVAVFFLAASPILLGRLYGKEFEEAWPIAFILLLIGLVSSVNETADRTLAAAGRIWLSTTNNLIWTIMFLFMALWCIPRLLALGYVSALLSTFILYVGLQIWWLRHLFTIDISLLSRIALTSVIFILTCFVVADSMSPTVQLIGAPTVTFICLIVEWRIFITSDEKSVLISLRRRATANSIKGVRRIL